MEEFIIRSMSKSDMDRVLEIIGMNNNALIQIAAKDLHDYFAKQDMVHEHYYVAQIEGKIVGFMGFHPDKWGVPDIYWAIWLYVDPSWHRRGIASSLYATIEKKLLELNCRKVYLDVGNPSEHQAAIAFHKSQGFLQEGYLKDFWEDGEDFIIFGKRLTPLPQK